MSRGCETVLEADVRLIATPEQRAVAQIIGGAGRKARPGAARGASERRRRDPSERTPCTCPWRPHSPHSDPRRPPRSRAAGPSARSARPTAGTGTGRPGSRTSAPTAIGIEFHPLLQLERHSWTSPVSMTSPRLSDCGPCTRRPLTLMPLVEPRSLTIQEPPEGRISAWWRETFGILEHDVGVARAAQDRAGGADDLDVAADAQPRAAAARIGLAQRLLHALGARVDHRVAFVALARAARAPARGGFTRRAWMPNSPSRSRSSVLNIDARLRAERDLLAPRVLEQVARQLATPARPRCPRTARGRRARARPCTRSARRRG